MANPRRPDESDKLRCSKIEQLYKEKAGGCVGHSDEGFPIDYGEPIDTDDTWWLCPNCDVPLRDLETNDNSTEVTQGCQCPKCRFTCNAKDCPVVNETGVCPHKHLMPPALWFCNRQYLSEDAFGFKIRISR
jgi:ssDNA-binding Zn-finger/Zn-ribbon topoisomerase 1